MQVLSSIEGSWLKRLADHAGIMQILKTCTSGLLLQRYDQIRVRTCKVFVRALLFLSQGSESPLRAFKAL